MSKKRYIITKTSTIFPPPKKRLGHAWDKHIKKLESNNYAGTLPCKVFIASQGIENDRTIFFYVTAENMKFAASQWPGVYF